MGVEVILAIIAFGIGVIVTPIYILLFVKGVRSLQDLRDLLGQPPRARAVEPGARRPVE
jgi:hypothetical protein